MIVDKATATANRAADPVENSINEVTTAYERYNHSAIELGGVLASIRNELKPIRKWTAFLKSKRLPFSRRKAEMLIAIHARFATTDAQMFAQMPSGWSVMYTLSSLSTDELKQAIASGELSYRTTLADARVLAGRPLSAPTGAESWANRVVNQLQSRAPEWSKTEREAVCAKLTAAAAQITPHVPGQILAAV